VLTLATLGLVGYALWDAARAAAGLMGPRGVEIWANLATIVLAVILLVSAALVRVRMPGGLALAIGALLGLQAFALNAAAGVYGTIALAPQIGRAVFAALVVLLALFGGRNKKMENGE
jgi:hypothetical protein